MPTLFITDTADKETAVTGQNGMTVMEIIRSAGFEDLLAACGGGCSCATCHIVVDPSWAQQAGPASPDEQDLLDGSDHVAATSRLSCQMLMSEALDGIKLRIAPEG